MKVHLGNLSPSALPGVGGEYILRDTRFGPVIQKRSRPRKSTETALQRYLRIRWAFACAMASSPIMLDRGTADFWSIGTEQTWRDLLTDCALGTHFEIIEPDGTKWGHVVLEPRKWPTST